MSALSLRIHAAGRAWRACVRQPGVLLVALLLATLACAVLLGAVLAGPTLWASWSRVQSLRSAEATVFITPGTSSSEVKALIGRAEAVPRVASVRLVSRDAALAELAGRRIGGAPAVPELKSNPLPDALVVRLDATASPAAIEGTLATLRKLARVDLVQFDGAWQQRLAALLAAALAVGALLAVTALLSIALALVASVRLLTAADLAEVRVLQLVGASPSTIVRPYAYVGAGLLLAASLLALAALLAGMRWAAPFMVDLPVGELLVTPAVPPWLIPAAFVGAAVLVGLALGGLAGRSALSAARLR